MEKLDTTSFENALNSLISIIQRYEKEQDIDIRDAVIQRFEYTYSLALKMVMRFINLQSYETPSTMTFNEIIREGNRHGLLNDNLEKWTEYRQMRNSTSHTYDEGVAQAVLSVIPDFKNEALFLLNRLKETL